MGSERVAKKSGIRCPVAGEGSPRKRVARSWSPPKACGRKRRGVKIVAAPGVRKEAEAIKTGSGIERDRIENDVKRIPDAPQKVEVMNDAAHPVPIGRVGR